jgi:hypothetical protein
MNTQTQEALKMAIEWMEAGLWKPTTLEAVINACKQALEQPAQEPVSLGDFDNMSKAECVDYIEYLRKEIDLLRFKEWQGLTDDEIIDMYFQANISPQPAEDVINFIRAIEQALRERNT